MLPGTPHLLGSRGLGSFTSVAPLSLDHSSSHRCGIVSLYTFHCPFGYPVVLVSPMPSVFTVTEAAPLPVTFPGFSWHQAIAPQLLSMTVSIPETLRKLRLQLTPRKYFPEEFPSAVLVFISHS